MYISGMEMFQDDGIRGVCPKLLSGTLREHKIHRLYLSIFNCIYEVTSPRHALFCFVTLSKLARP